MFHRLACDPISLKNNNVTQLASYLLVLAYMEFGEVDKYLYWGNDPTEGGDGRK